jgi:[ribosomal protein S5]-alanine N-acetyltransferase
MSWLSLPHFPTLETSRLLLREVVESDFDAFHALFKDEAVNEHIQLPWAEPAEARKMFDALRDRFGKGEGIRWTIVLKATNEWIGNFGFRKPRVEERCVERGLQIVSTHWRKGYGHEASVAATDWLLEHTPFRNVDAWIATSNLPAIRLIEKQGFRDSGDRQPFREPLILARYVKSLV